MLSQLEFVNFRNLKNARLTFSPQLNIFYGNNAQGKTNLLEGIYLLSTGKSFRAETDKELINWNKDGAKLVGQAPPLTIEIEILPKVKKLSVNRQQKRLVDLVGEFTVVLFAPEDLQLVNGSPAQRRAWLNSLISKVDKSYLLDLIKFNQVLRNRNRILFLLKQGMAGNLEVWTEQTIPLERKIWNERKKWVHEINSTLRPLAKKLGLNKIFLEYQPQLELPEDRQEEVLKKEFAKMRGEEIGRSQTLIGPHRDEFKIIFEEIEGKRIVAKDVGVYGSRGEQRTAVLSLKLAELDLIEKVKGKRPTLLLDDVLSEFDETHRDMVQALLYNQQSFITTTSLEVFKKRLTSKAKSFQVDEGVFMTNDQEGGKALSVSSEE